MDQEEFFDELIDDDGLLVLDVYLDDEDNPIIPATIDGRPTNLDEWDAFCVPGEEGDPIIMQPDVFFSMYMPSRLLFAGAGHG